MPIPINYKDLVLKTFEFPQGCDEQKVEFLKTFGLNDDFIREAREGTPIKLQVLAKYVGKSQTINEALTSASDLVIPGATVVGRPEYKSYEGGWSKVDITVTNRKKFAQHFGIVYGGFGAYCEVYGEHCGAYVVGYLPKAG